MSEFHPSSDPSRPPGAPVRSNRPAAVAAFLAPIALLAGLLAWLASDDGPRHDPERLSEAAVLQRIAPVARHVTASQEQGAETPEAPPAPAAADAAPGTGQKLYQSVCFACHATGVADAPVLGDREAWAPYLATGTEAMLQAVMQGKGAMPPKGGADDATEQDLRAAIDYLTAAAR